MLHLIGMTCLNEKYDHKSMIRHFLFICLFSFYQNFVVRKVMILKLGSLPLCTCARIRELESYTQLFCFLTFRIQANVKLNITYALKNKKPWKFLI